MLRFFFRCTRIRNEEQLVLDVLEITAGKQTEMVKRRNRDCADKKDAEVGATRREASSKSNEEVQGESEGEHEGG